MRLVGLSNQTLLGRLGRLPLRLIPKGQRVPVLRGPLRGMRWIVGSAVHGCWLGTYENEKQSLMQRTVGIGSVAYDVGAHVGFYSLLLSRLVGPSGKVVAFEPFPRNVAFLRRHVGDNDLHNVEIIEAAVSDVAGTVQFADAPSSTMGAISEGGRLSVKSVQLDRLVSEGRIPPPSFMKIDVEGAEEHVLRGAAEILSRHRPTIFVATHSHALRMTCAQILENAGYDVQQLGDDKYELAGYPR